MTSNELIAAWERAERLRLSNHIRTLESQNAQLCELVRVLVNADIAVADHIWPSYPAIAAQMRAFATQAIRQVENPVPHSQLSSTVD